MQILLCNGCHECDDHRDEFNCTRTSHNKDVEGRNELRCLTDAGNKTFMIPKIATRKLITSFEFSPRVKPVKVH